MKIKPKMKKITIIDYGCGNILSLKRAIQEIGFSSSITNNKKKILNSDFLILPGVGAFSNAMNLLNNFQLEECLKEYVIYKKKMILGICLGMQIFLTKSYEMGQHYGLNFIEGEVINMNKFSKNKNIKIPHTSWNEIYLNKKANLKILNNGLLNKDFYFIHSYLAHTKDKNNIYAYSKYFDIKIPAVIGKDNIIGCQFHPEKSGINGLNFLKNTLNLN